MPVIVVRFKEKPRVLQAYLICGEVLELNQQLGKDDGHLVHEFLHKLVHLRLRYPRLPQAEIQGIFQELLVVCADVDANWNGR